MQKGTSHVDWAISVGLFVVYVLLLFIFLKPGAEPSYSTSSLFKIVEYNLHRDAKYSMEKTPVFIRPIPGDFPELEGNYQVSIECAELPMPYEVVFPPHAAVIMHNNSALPFRVELRRIGIRRSDKLRLNATFSGSSSTYLFFLLNASNNNYTGSLSEESNRLMNHPYNPPVCPVKRDEVMNFTYEFGVAETLEGFSNPTLGNLVDYDYLKKKWNFPPDRDFIINITNASTGGVLRTINNAQIPVNANVFVNSYKDWILEPNSDLSPIRLEIVIW